MRHTSRNMEWHVLPVPDTCNRLVEVEGFKQKSVGKYYSANSKKVDEVVDEYNTSPTTADNYKPQA